MSQLYISSQHFPSHSPSFTLDVIVFVRDHVQVLELTWQEIIIFISFNIDQVFAVLQSLEGLP